MTRFRISPAHRKHLPDLVAGLSVLVLLLVLMTWHVGIAMESGGSVRASLDWNASAVLVAGAFAAMTVFNMAFFRHISRVYTAPRKAAARRRALRSGRGPRT